MARCNKVKCNNRSSSLNAQKRRVGHGRAIAYVSIFKCLLHSPYALRTPCKWCRNMHECEPCSAYQILAEISTSSSRSPRLNPTHVCKAAEIRNSQTLNWLLHTPSVTSDMTRARNDSIVWIGNYQISTMTSCLSAVCVTTGSLRSKERRLEMYPCKLIERNELLRMSGAQEYQ